MIGTPKTNTLQTSVISGVVHEGLSVTLRDGRKGRLAIVDEDGQIVEAGPAVAREAWNVTVSAYKNFMIGLGHIRIYSSPTGRSMPSGSVASTS
ncbi:hypothetical protein FNU76_15695 [Chitinimonas arctica]|uniref:Uncharacterized protein n=1 Tax=Chitinimonas arctica TaxID=2594795 RepID=A0A516SHP7_9NEIS|nr:hypothetical protein FNU76_15695 [Chitinimonas arctica]